MRKACGEGQEMLLLFNSIRQEVLPALMTLFFVWEESSRILLVRVGCRTSSREPIPGWSACACSLGLGSCSVRIKSCPPTQSSTGSLVPSLEKIRNTPSKRNPFLSRFLSSNAIGLRREWNTWGCTWQKGLWAPSKCWVIPAQPQGLVIPAKATVLLMRTVLALGQDFWHLGRKNAWKGLKLLWSFLKLQREVFKLLKEQSGCLISIAETE